MTDDNTTNSADASVAAQNQTASTAQATDVGNAPTVNTAASALNTASTLGATDVADKNEGSLGSTTGEASGSTGVDASGEAQTQSDAATTGLGANTGNAAADTSGTADAGDNAGESKAASTETSSVEVKAADPVKVHGHSLVEANAHLIEPAQHRNKLTELLHGVVNEAERAEHWTVEELLEVVTYLRAKV